LVIVFAGAASAQNKISTVAGGGVINSNPALADIPGPTGVVEDASGNKYVAAPTTDYIFQLTPSNTVNTFAGMGFGHYSINGGHNGVATQEPLYYSSGLGVDTHGSVYIADTVNNTIRKVYLNGKTHDIVTVAGRRQGCILQNWPTCNDGAPATDAYLANPQGAVVDAAGNLYIADTGNNVIRFVSAKTPHRISLFAGSYNNGVACSDPIGNPTTVCGDGGPATEALLNGPMGVSLDGSNNLYIADSYDNRIRCVLAVVGGCGDVSHAYAVGDIITVVGFGAPCTIYNDGPNNNPPYCGDGGPATQAKIGRPGGVSVSASGAVIFVADTRPSLIRVISAGTINTFAGMPESPGFAGDGGAATAAELTNPSGVYLDASGNVLIADTGNQRIREVNVSGQINTIMGGGFGGDGAAATSAMLANPYQVALDANNNFYIADAANNRVRVVNTSPSNPITVATVTVPPLGIATIAGNGDVGYSGDTGPATLATMDGPFGVAVDASGDILISDSQNGWVREVNATTGIISTLSATKPVTLPAALAIDTSGNLFIADPPAQVIWEVSGSTITQVVGTGQRGYSGDGGPATAAELDEPSGIAIDANENLYIADSGNNVIRCVSFNAGGCGNASNQAGYIYTYAYNGGYNFQGDGGLAIDAERWDPTEVAVDAPRGNVCCNLFIGGGQFAVVQRVDAATGTIITVAGNDKDQPSFGFSGDGGPATIANLNNMGLIVDPNENLLIADNGNNRIREVPLVAVAKLSPSSLTFGDQKVKTTSPPQTVTLTDIGADDLVLSSISITGVAAGDFAQTNNCPTTLTPELVPPQACTIKVTFTPTRKGRRKAVLTFTDNGYKNPQQVPLTGTGD
jgi:sugar lactone lactonase YvrE